MQRASVIKVFSVLADVHIASLSLCSFSSETNCHWQGNIVHLIYILKWVIQAETWVAVITWWACPQLDQIVNITLWKTELVLRMVTTAHTLAMGATVWVRLQAGILGQLWKLHEDVIRSDSLHQWTPYLIWIMTFSPPSAALAIILVITIIHPFYFTQLSNEIPKKYFTSKYEAYFLCNEGCRFMIIGCKDVCSCANMCCNANDGQKISNRFVTLSFFGIDS